jgi:hypothetical protein
VNHGEIWTVDDGRGYRLVVSTRSFNETGRVISAAVGGPPSRPRPLTIPCRQGTVYTDMILYHPRTWLASPAGRLDEEALDELRHQLLRLLELG